MDGDGLGAAVEKLCALLEGRVDSYELYLASSRGTSVEARDGRVDAFRVSESAGVGLRVISGGRPGFAYSSVFTGEALARMAELAVSGSAGAAEDKALGFPGPSRAQVDPGALAVSDPAFDEGTEEERIARALAIEEAARGFDPRVNKVRKAGYGELTALARVVNSRGVDTEHSATFYSGSVMAVAEEAKESQMGFFMGHGHMRGEVDCEEIGTEAARRAAELLGGRTIGTVRCPAVFENTVVTELLGVLAGSFLAENVCKGKSMLVGKAGRKVASEAVSLIDDGTIPGGWSSSPCDCEGVPRQRTPLVTGGVCEGFLYDTYWAGREGKKSTGNAARAGFKGTPSVGISNLHIEGGEKPLDGLFAEMGKGLFITELMGVHTADPVSGDFSLGASGLWVEEGKTAYPVRGIAVAGNILELFGAVEAVGADKRFFGSVGAPSLLVGRVSASGASS